MDRMESYSRAPVQPEQEGSKVSEEDAKNLEELLVTPENNELQLKLMELWAKNQPEEFADNNAIAKAWIGSEMAEKYRKFAENSHEEFSLTNETRLNEVLKELDQNTQH